MDNLLKGRRACLKVLLAASSAIALPNAAFAQSINVGILGINVQRLAGGVAVTNAAGTIYIEILSENIVKIERTRASQSPVPSLCAIGTFAPVEINIATQENLLLVKSAHIQVQLNLDNGQVKVMDNAANVYLSENAEPTQYYPIAGLSTPADGVVQKFESPTKWDGSAQNAYFGLGQHQNGLMNLRQAHVHLQQVNGDVAIPFLMSTAGFGLLWDNASVTDVYVNMPGRTGIEIRSESDRAAYYVMVGATPDDIIAQYRQLTGPVPMFPRWAWGFWQSKEHYESQDELLAVAHQYRAMGVPLDAVIQDWQYWKPGEWGRHEMDPARFPNPTQMMAELHSINVHAIISVWPRFDVDTDNLAALEAAGVVYPPVFNNVYPPGRGKWYDAFHPEGRRLYWQQISDRLGVHGWDGFWLDAAEAELGGAWGQMRDMATGLGSGRAVYNAYPLFHAKGVCEGQRRDRPNKRALSLIRSAWAGQQHYGAITWSGDIHGDWETYRRQVPSGLNFVASGIPYWNTDIGGFFGGDPADPHYRELFLRWFQYGAFNPMFRVHGTGKPKEIWRFDEAAQQIWRRTIALRYSLIPYIYSTSWQVTHNGASMMRPLMMDYPHDEFACGVRDQFMFGPHLLINPVMYPGAETRPVYLPGNGPWYDFFTNQSYGGNDTITANAPIDHLPIYVRPGAILPIGPAVQFANQAVDAPLEIRIYRGADGRFELYDDAGDGYGYEAGEYNVTEFVWDDAHKRLSLSSSGGTYPNMATEKRFIVNIISQNGQMVRRAIRYGRQRLQVSF